MPSAAQRTGVTLVRISRLRRFANRPKGPATVSDVIMGLRLQARIGGDDGRGGRRVVVGYQSVR
ncbi:hypothetical protein ACFFX0_04415 [Citricoccus parietis]|uniref:Uncharacterized protein n=1 Tax=Citricoccus parietis TaxID=592307 RepID=A0ABV5FUV8_9MICC